MVPWRKNFLFIYNEKGILRKKCTLWEIWKLGAPFRKFWNLDVPFGNLSKNNFFNLNNKKFKKSCLWLSWSRGTFVRSPHLCRGHPCGITTPSQSHGDCSSRDNPLCRHLYRCWASGRTTNSTCAIWYRMKFKSLVDAMLILEYIKGPLAKSLF